MDLTQAPIRLGPIRTLPQGDQRAYQPDPLRRGRKQGASRHPVLCHCQRLAGCGRNVRRPLPRMPPDDRQQNTLGKPTNGSPDHPLTGLLPQSPLLAPTHTTLRAQILHPGTSHRPHRPPSNGSNRPLPSSLPTHQSRPQLATQRRSPARHGTLHQDPQQPTRPEPAPDSPISRQPPRSHGDRKQSPQRQTLLLSRHPHRPRLRKRATDRHDFTRLLDVGLPTWRTPTQSSNRARLRRQLLTGCYSPNAAPGDHLPAGLPPQLPRTLRPGPPSTRIRPRTR